MKEVSAILQEARKAMTHETMTREKFERDLRAYKPDEKFEKEDIDFMFMEMAMNNFFGQRLETVEDFIKKFESWYKAYMHMLNKFSDNAQG
jgi:hypothetical protein